MLEEEELPKKKAAVKAFYKDQLTTVWSQQAPQTPLNIDHWLTSLDELGWHQQYWYLAKNKFDYLENYKMRNSADEASYSGRHSQIHIEVDDFRQANGISNIYLIGPDNGRILYSSYKRPDFFTTLTDTTHANTPLATLYRQAKEAEPDSTFFHDTILSEAAFGQPSTYIAAPIHDHGDKFLGVIVLEIPTERLTYFANSTSNDTTSMETLVIGNDGLLRSDSLHAAEVTAATSLTNKQQLFPELTNNDTSFLS